MTTTKHLSQSVTFLPSRQLQKQPKTSLKTQDKLCILGVIAGTVFTTVSQQAASACIPLLGLLLMQRANQHRLTLAQQQQQQITAVVDCAFNSLSTQIQQLETHTNETDSPQNYLTKTHLTPIIAKLHQLQQDNNVFKLKELRNLAQQIDDWQQQLNELKKQTENLQASQQKLEQQFQQPHSRSKPSCQSKHTQNHLPGNNRVAIFIDGANLYHSAAQLGLEIDYAHFYSHFLSLFQKQFSSSQAFFYTGIDSSIKQQNFLLKLQRLGYKIVSKAVIKRADGSSKANLDVELALDLLDLADTYDTAILASGDGDFAAAVKRIQLLGKRVEVVSYHSTTSHKLIELADDYFDLETLTDLRQIA